MKKLIATTAFAALLIAAAPAAVMAQTTDTTVPNHPRVNEVDQRLQNQQNRIDAGVANGQINANQAARDQKTDAKVSQELSADEAKNGGHITKAEQTHMNNQLNKDSTRIRHQRTKAGTPAATPAVAPAAPAQ